MDPEPSISADVIAQYAEDAAQDVGGMSVPAESPLHRGRAVDVALGDGTLDVTLHVQLDWGSNAAAVGEALQGRVREYVERMTSKSVGGVEVVVERVGAPPA